MLKASGKGAKDMGRLIQFLYEYWLAFLLVGAGALAVWLVRRKWHKLKVW